MRRIKLLERDWPEADRALLAQLTAQGGVLDESGPLSHLRQVSREFLVISYGRWLGWLSREEPAALSEPPLARATPERFRAWLTSMSHLAPQRRLNWGRLALRLLKAARPDMDWSGHTRALQLLWREATDHRSSRKDGRIISSAVLLKAARERYETQGYGSAPADFRSAKARRNAVMVAFLAVLPIRRRAFCGLEIGTSLQGTTTGLRVVLESEDLKVGPPWEAQVPSPLAELLADYLQHVRPVLQARGKSLTQALWLNEHGRPYNPVHLSTRIREITFDLVGVRVTPHFFRDAAATTLAYASPESARLTRAILGHSGFRTGEKHYNQATMVDAGRKYADLIARPGGRDS